MVAAKSIWRFAADSLIAGIGFIFAAVAIIAVFLAKPSEAQAPQWKGTITKVGEVVVVRNPREPIYREPIITLKEDWFIGGEKAQGEYAIAFPYGLAIDGDGCIYVYELRESRIKVFDSEGRFLRSFGRKGQGPEDIGFTTALFIAGDAKEIAFPDFGNRRFSFFSFDGKLLRSVPVRGRGFSRAAIDSKGAIYLYEINPGSPDSLKKMDPACETVLTEIFSHPQDESRNPFAPRDLWTLDYKDRLFYGNARTYEIRIFNPDGGLSRRIVREHEGLEVTKKEIDEFESRKTPPGINPVYNYSSHHAAFRSFFVDDEGHLFVQTWERTSDNRQDVHDVFDAEGRFLGRVSLPRHADLINPKVRILKKGKFYAIEPDPDGYEVLKRYSVTWIKGQTP